MRKLGDCPYSSQPQQFPMSENGTRSSRDRIVVRLENDRLCVFDRDGIYQARIRIGPNRYIWRSLRTRSRLKAISAARSLFHSIEYKQQEGLPLTNRKFSYVMDEYIAYRQTQYLQGRTSDEMLHRITAILKFWREYNGDVAVTSIGNRELSGYIEWRRGYYAQFKTLPRNAKLVPADTTLQFEMMVGKSVLRFAHDRGYFGKQPLPTFSFIAKNNRVRPAFELSEYRGLLRAMVKWRRNCPNERWLHARKLLIDYVLVLASSGMRVGEANNLKVRDVEPFKDDLGRRNYRFRVKGKTGERDVILRASAVKSVDRLLKRRADARTDDRLFAMWDGSHVGTLSEQFNKALTLANNARSSHGEKYTLYSLRHFYAVRSLQRGVGVFELARNMGTSVEMIQAFYGKHATPRKLATQLGG